MIKDQLKKIGRSYIEGVKIGAIMGGTIALMTHLGHGAGFEGGQNIEGPPPRLFIY